MGGRTICMIVSWAGHHVMCTSLFARVLFSYTVRVIDRVNDVFFLQAVK